MLEVKDVWKRYGDREVLKGIGFTGNKGEIITLLGDNGAGKTTCFRCILALEDADKGEILFNKRKITGRMTGYLPEDRSMYYDCPVDRQLRHFGRLKGMNNSQLDSSLNRLYQVMGTGQFKDVIPLKLSKGNQQKIQLMLAVLHDPELVILDEPWTGLDSGNVDVFQHVFMDLKKRNSVILLSSHQQYLADQVTDRYLYLKDGHIAINVSTKQLAQARYSVVELEHPQRCIYVKDERVLFQNNKGRLTKLIMDNRNDSQQLLQQLRNTGPIRITERKMQIQDLIEAS